MIKNGMKLVTHIMTQMEALEEKENLNMIKKAIQS
jgi:histone acetyltransferase (RNA polymerase elongator complex component)